MTSSLRVKAGTGTLSWDDVDDFKWGMHLPDQVAGCACVGSFTDKKNYDVYMFTRCGKVRDALVSLRVDITIEHVVFAGYTTSPHSQVSGLVWSGLVWLYGVWVLSGMGRISGGYFTLRPH